MTAKKAIPRYSGHEPFVCRYSWLPKVVTELDKNPALFSDEDNAMVRLGIGKNMVCSAKFCAEVTQAIEDREDGRQRVTGFGRDLLGHDGFDQFLERPEALWLLQWKIATHPARPLFHWQQMLNYWHRPKFAADAAMRDSANFETIDNPQITSEAKNDLVYDGRWNGCDTPTTGNANYVWILCISSKSRTQKKLDADGNRTICFHSQAA